MLKSSFRDPGKGFTPMADSDRMQQYEYLQARVVNNSVTSQYNYLTLDKGSVEGVEPDMAVATDRGIVGIVVSVSLHYSLVISLLNRDLKVSARLQGSREPGTVEWPGRSTKRVVLRDIPHDTRIIPGDTVVTSGLSPIFPEKLWIGFVEKYRIEGGSFYTVDVLLANDFRKLQWVYIIRNRLRNEQIKLESSLNQ
jgi:rod shape-determining protein MreC